MSGGGEWAVAFILLTVCIVILVIIAVVCRLVGFSRLSSMFVNSEEKMTLAGHECRPQNAYMAASQGGKFESRTIATEDANAKRLDLRGLTSPDLPNEDADDRTKDISPVSADSLSMTSDYEPTAGLQRAMSCDSVTSDSSIIDAEVDVPKIGQLEFGLEYDRDLSELVISVIQARDLEKSELTGSLDSFVKLWLNPHTDGKSVTKTQRGTTNPVFTERFLFNVPSEELDNKTVQFQVFSSDKYARQKLLGETDLLIGDIDLRRPIRVWMNLRNMDEKPPEYGAIMYSLSYLPTAERLTTVIVKARNLKWAAGKHTGDCFVKVYLLQNGKKFNKKKTSTKRDEKNPIFNEAMTFSVPSTALQKVQLRINVVECLPDGRTTSVGHTIVGSQVTGTELSHWSQMMTSLRKPVAMWHSLRK